MCVCACTHMSTHALSRSVVSNSLWPHGPKPARLLCPWDSPGNTGVGSHSLLQGIYPTQNGTLVSCTAGRFFSIWATREALCLLLGDAHWSSSLPFKHIVSARYKKWPSAVERGECRSGMSGDLGPQPTWAVWPWVGHLSSWIWAIIFVKALAWSRGSGGPFGWEKENSILKIHFEKKRSNNK